MKKSFMKLFWILPVMVGLLAACVQATPAPANTPTPRATLRPPPTSTPVTPTSAATSLASSTPVEVPPVSRSSAVQEVNVDAMVTTESGLQYLDLVVGTGAAASPGATAVVHYTGWLEDGTKFDSSLDRGDPFQFVIGEGMVIQGWDEGVASMKVGGKRELTIPSNLAYGDSGYAGVIPPGATLIFEIELLELR